MSNSQPPSATNSPAETYHKIKLWKVLDISEAGKTLLWAPTEYDATELALELAKEKSAVHHKAHTTGRAEKVEMTYYLIAESGKEICSFGELPDTQDIIEALRQTGVAGGKYKLRCEAKDEKAVDSGTFVFGWPPIDCGEGKKRLPGETGRYELWKETVANYDWAEGCQQQEAEAARPCTE